MILRPYQNKAIEDVNAQWRAGRKNVCLVQPTGSGKTVVFANVLKQEPAPSFAIAHRQELISQMSMALAYNGVRHKIQASEAMIKWIISLHMRNIGKHYYDAHARRTVVGVRTFINRAEQLKHQIAAAGLWVVDEAHHITRGNEWGKAVALFPGSCKGLAVTAAPIRSDGKGLGRHADGVLDSLVIGPTGRDMINAGYLSDYRLFAPKTVLNLDQVPISRTGDYSKPKLTVEVRKSTITGDVVEQYLRIAPGQIGVTFVTDVQTAAEVSASYNAAGVPAEVVHAKTPDKVRQAAVENLARGDRKQLVNVDIFGEGFDLPAISVCSMARPTQSYGLYVQQFGRALRPMEGKTHAIIIDHVGNIERHASRGLPDGPQVWTLDAREKRSKSLADPDIIPIRVCVNCTAVYESWQKLCPYCGHMYEPEKRDTVEQVEGDLYELNPALLEAMRASVLKVDVPEEVIGDRLRFAGAAEIAVMGAMKNHRLRQEAQTILRHIISIWAGRKRAEGFSDSRSYTVFYRTFGIDVMSAQALGRRPAMELAATIRRGLK